MARVFIGVSLGILGTLTYLFSKEYGADQVGAALIGLGLLLAFLGGLDVLIDRLNLVADAAAENVPSPGTDAPLTREQTAVELLTLLAGIDGINVLPDSNGNVVVMTNINEKQLIK